MGGLFPASNGVTTCADDLALERSTHLPRVTGADASRGCCVRDGGALQRHQGHGREARASEDVRRLSLSPGRKSQPRNASSSTWREIPYFRFQYGRRGGYKVVLINAYLCRLSIISPFGSRCFEIEKQNIAGCMRRINDMQLWGTPAIGWAKVRVGCHWANVVKVTVDRLDTR